MNEPGAYRVFEAGEPLASARKAMIMVHGRGATAQDILTIAPELKAEGVAYLAPQAPNNAWYPNPFTAPLDSNEPYLSSALQAVSSLVARAEAVIPAERIMLLGFSQGACLTLEFAARNARRYGAVFGLSGGLIGPDGTPHDYPGRFDGTPAFLGCSDVDPFIPKDRVTQAGEWLERMGASVTVRLYPGMGHEVSPDEIAAMREIVDSI
ncbi:MAG: alpha/beta hydrolase [Candidatus Dormibacterales bacterium]